jgi:hypothetical protein
MGSHIALANNERAPSLVRSIEQASNVYQRQGKGKEELDRLVDMLDDYEIEIGITYLSNLLLSRAKPNVRSHSHRTR